jgi:hypothetical protein
MSKIRARTNYLATRDYTFRDDAFKTRSICATHEEMKLFTAHALAPLPTLALAALATLAPLPSQAWQCPQPLKNTNALSFAKLSQAIERNPGIRTPEQLVSCLPEEFRSQFLLIYESRALQRQCVSPLKPRVALFNDPTSFVLTASDSDPSNPLCESPALEGFEFKPETSSFVFRSIHFSRDERPRMSEENPRECLRCHGADPRPLFDPYFIWPGFYGSNDDNTLTADRLKDGDALPPESRNYMTFLERAGLGIYSQLVWTPDRRIPRSRPAGENIDITPYERPNTTFGIGVSRVNLFRVQRLATDFAQWDRYKYALAYATHCASDVSDLSKWIPAEMLGARPYLPPMSRSRFSELSSFWHQGLELPPSEREKLGPEHLKHVGLIEGIVRRWSKAVPLPLAAKYSSANLMEHPPHLYRPLSDYLYGLSLEVTAPALHLVAYLYSWAGVDTSDWFTHRSGGIISGDGRDDAHDNFKKIFRAAIPELPYPITGARCEELANQSLRALRSSP